MEAPPVPPPSSDGKIFRPQHKKQPSRSNIFKALVSPTKQKGDAVKSESHSKPITSITLGERHLNIQTPTSSPTKGNVTKDNRFTNQDASQKSAHPLRSPFKKENLTKSQASRSPEKLPNLSPSKNASLLYTPTRKTDEYDVFSDQMPTERKANAVRSSRKEETADQAAVRGRSREQTTDKKRNNSTFRFMQRSTRAMTSSSCSPSKESLTDQPQQTKELDAKSIEAEFKALLDARHIPSAMRQNMRDLTLRVKADLVRQNHGSVVDGIDPNDKDPKPEVEQDDAIESRSTKRSRPRSRTFTFSKGDKSFSFSPSKKQRSRSRSRIDTSCATDGNEDQPSSAKSPRASSRTRKSKIEKPEEYIQYLKAEQDPTKVEVGRLHKLRILLRNETMSWVNAFIDLDGMPMIISLLHSIMKLEWREEHEDQLLHETLLCLKGLCTTDTALAELRKYADALFPALLGMLFDDEKKGPAEYTTRTIIINILFAYLAMHNRGQQDLMVAQGKQVLAFLGEPVKQDDEKPLTFVTEMHASRPYKLWCREVTNVTKEVFWIFLHQLNVISSSRPSTANTDGDFTTRHFPGIRPPVPAAPYIGGVEWDATTYLAAHLDLLNGTIALMPSREERNALRQQLQASGFEKTMGGTLRMCKEKFYAGVHDGLRSWVAAAAEDGWPTLYVREGPSLEEQAQNAKSSSPKKAKQEPAPQIGDLKVDMPALDLGLDDFTKHDDNSNTDWIG